MLKLYSKALNSKTLKEIDETAQELRNYLLTVQRTHFARDKPHFSKTYPTMVINQFTIGKHCLGIEPIRTPTSTLIYVLFSTLYNIDETTKDDRSFYLTSLTINFFAPSNIIPRLLRSLSVPESQIPDFHLIALSGIQVYSYQHIFKTINANMLDLFSRYVSVTLLNFLQRTIILKSRKINSYLLRMMISLGTSLALATLNQKIATVGIPQLIADSIEAFLNFYVGDAEMERLPDDLDMDVPTSIQCVICRGLLVQPVVVSNNFYCKECLERWMKDNDLDPMTGLPINHDEIKRNIPMEQLVKNYYDLKMKEYENQTESTN